MTNLANVWDFGFMWEAFTYFLKLAAPFVMLIVAILGVGALVLIIVIAVTKAVRN